MIPHATVTITLNAESGESRVVQTDGEGNYTAANLPAGTYTITVKAANFEAYKTDNVVLNVAQKRPVNAQLKPGAESQTVVVQDNPVAIETDSSAQAGTIDGTQMRELELINRNFQTLVTLQPGVVNMLGDEPGFGLGSVSSISVNGARSTANNWSVDGADINDSGSNATLLNIPSVDAIQNYTLDGTDNNDPFFNNSALNQTGIGGAPASLLLIDAIQEFTLERSSYDASFGRSGGGQILVSTRSGTSAFHGSAYEFVRTANTNANTYFNNHLDLPRAPDHYNDFGFTAGGPIFIPHVYNADRKKTFFFWSEEWRKITAPASNNVSAATPAELAGTFYESPTHYAQTVAAVGAGCLSSYDASTGVAVANPSCYSANAKVYLAQIVSKFPANYTAVNPSTGFTDGDNITSYSTLNNFRQDLVRVDHYFNDRLHFFARGMNDTCGAAPTIPAW